LQAHLIDPTDVNTHVIIWIDAEKWTRDAAKKRKSNKSKKAKRKTQRKMLVGDKM
jgi:hypothetical protein